MTSGQEINSGEEFAARDLVLQKIETIARARGYAFWANYVNQINYWDYSFGDEVGVEIMCVDGSLIFDGASVIGVSISAMQGDVTTEKISLLWLRPNDKADHSNLDLPRWLCDFEPYALEEARVVKSRSLSYWEEKAGTDGLLRWKKQFCQEELDVELSMPPKDSLTPSKRIHMLVYKSQEYGECSRHVEIAVDMP